MIRKVLAGVGITAALFAVEAGYARADKCTLKPDAVHLTVGTAAAPGSPWGSVFTTWKTVIEQKTGCAYTLDFFFNQSQGSEVTMVDKMIAKQLDIVAVTSVGLGKIDKKLLALQVPGVIRDFGTLDKVRTTMGSEFEGFLTAKKVKLITWGDVGYAHFISKGFAVHTPADLKGKNPWVYPDEPIVKMVYSKIGGVNAFPAELMQVGPNIDNGKINAMAISMLAAEMLQWNSKFDNGIDDINGIVSGAVVMSAERLAALPADVQATITDTGAKMGSSASGLKAKIRGEDAAAWTRFKGRSGVTIYALTASDKTAWDATFNDARTALKAGTFDSALVGRIEAAAK